jgi:hypothetical protein
MDLVQTGKEVQGTASYSTKGGTGIGATFGIRQSGPVTGTVNGNSIQLRTSWGADYTGGVGSDAFFGGGTRDPKGSEVASWRSDRAATCLVAEGKIQGLGKKGFPPPAGKIQGLVPPPAGKNLWLGKQKFKTATAANDVNIHDGPGGNFNIMKCPGGYEGNCIMRKDDTAPILDFHPDGWYQLKLNVPGGSGWVAEDHLTLDVK